MNRVLMYAALAMLAVPTTGWTDEPKAVPEKPTFGEVIRFDAQLDALIDTDAKIEKLAAGFDWSEGPVWWPHDGSVLFSDVPANRVYRWKDGEPLSVFLEPSGYTGDVPRGGEPGSNGLALDKQKRLVLCQHGDRQVARLEPDGSQTVLTDNYQGKKYNSPNDLVYHSNGDLYFTDPPYGLLQRNEDPTKEMDYNGVFRLKPDGTVELLTKELPYPNGIALSPDEKTLYVAQSDPKNPHYFAFALQEDGSLGQKKILFDGSALAKQGKKGLPDGLKIDEHGNLWATGPGGVLVLSPQGKLLGLISTGERIANVGWGDDGQTLYLTSDMYLARVRTKVKGLGWVSIPGNPPRP